MPVKKNCINVNSCNFRLAYESCQGLQPRHTKLAVGAASTLAVFLAETHNERGAYVGCPGTAACFRLQCSAVRPYKVTSMGDTEPTI